MKHPKKYLAVLMAISILLCSVIAITSSAADSSQGESELEIEELQPVMASACNGMYVPATWTVDYSYRGSSIEYVCYLHGWTLSGSNILDNGRVIGRYDTGHYMDGQWTVSHFHIDSDIANGYGNIHYIF